MLQGKAETEKRHLCYWRRVDFIEAVCFLNSHTLTENQHYQACKFLFSEVHLRLILRRFSATHVGISAS